MTLTVAQFNRVFSWPFAIGLAGLLSPLAEGPSIWVTTMLFALPSASFIILSIALSCRTRGRPLGYTATVLRCLWAAVVSFGSLGPAAMVAHQWFSGWATPALVLIAVPLGVAVCEVVHRGITAFDTAQTEEPDLCAAAAPVREDLALVAGAR